MQITGNVVKFGIIMVFVANATKSFSQNKALGTWTLINTEYYYKNKYFLWAEVQTRSQEVYNDFYYHEMKGGVGFKPNSNVTFLLGVGQYGTYGNGGNFKSPVMHEFRLWEQLVLNNTFGRGKIEHRYRIEQRWRGGEYRNRFRYRFNPVISINKKKLEKGSLFVTAYDEIFLTDVGPHFERNRVFGGLGYQFSNPLMVQAGWLNQFDYGADHSSSNKNFLQVGLYLQLNRQ
jgi:hypothetical protein